MKEPVLQLPNLAKPFTIATDASKYASGGVLLQKDSNGEWHPCSYLSQSFGPTEWNYDIYNRELLAIIHALKTWRHYLQRSETKVQVFTDHKNLLYFKEARKLNRQQARWMLDLTDYDLKLVHIPGKQLSAPDALSRRPDFIPKEDTNNEGVTLLPQTLFVRLVDMELNQKIAQSTKNNPQVLNALYTLENKTPAPFRFRLSDWKYDAEILTYQG